MALGVASPNDQRMPKDICRTFGMRIRSLRDARDLTQEDLSNETGIAARTISYIENGKLEPCLRNIQALARGLGVSLSELMQGL